MSAFLCVWCKHTRATHWAQVINPNPEHISLATLWTVCCQSERNDAVCTDNRRRAPGINSLYITLMTGQGSPTTHKLPAAGQHAPGVDAIDLGHDSTWASVLPVACTTLLLSFSFTRFTLSPSTSAFVFCRHTHMGVEAHLLWYTCCFTLLSFCYMKRWGL